MTTGKRLADLRKSVAARDFRSKLLQRPVTLRGNTEHVHLYSLHAVVCRYHRNASVLASESMLEGGDTLLSDAQILQRFTYCRRTLWVVATKQSVNKKKTVKLQDLSETIGNWGLVEEMACRQARAEFYLHEQLMLTGFFGCFLRHEYVSTALWRNPPRY